MRIKGDIITDILVQLGVSTTVGFYTDQILDDWIDKAHKWATGYHKWPFTEGRVKTTYVVDNVDIEVGFNYPEGWKPDSIRMLQVGGKRFKKKNFYKYMEFREDYSSDTEKIFSDHGNLYFINPRADVSGTTTLWGQYGPATLGESDNSVTTLFSDVAEEGNEAIVEEVLGYAKKKEKKLQEALAHHKRAVEILEEIWTRVKDEQYGYGDVNSEGLFKRVDILQGDFHSDLIRRDQWF